MKLPLAYYGNPILRKKGKFVSEIDNTIKQLVADMIETMEESDGIGIAAPQVHQSLAIFITQTPIPAPDDKWDKGETKIFINPKILSRGDEEFISSEGCLSIPKVYGDISRPWKISVEYTDLNGVRQVEEFEGLAARIFMHENDHINGTLFIDRMDSQSRQEIESQLKEIKKKFSQNK